jgi:HD-like signal output (HDOD) protein
MAGLLHDIGKIVMNQFMHDDFIKVMDKVNADDCLFRDAEKAVLDFDHSELGALLLERWNLPHKLVDAVRYCYRPSEAEENLELAAVTHFGHVLSRSLCVGSAGDARVTPLDQAAFERLGIPWDRVDMLMGKITAELANADEFLVLA